MKGELDELFIHYSTQKLLQMCANIEDCLGRLSDEQIWSRGAPSENSVGNLILHLCGNVRQWICSGVGGEPDVRERDSEFAAKGGLARADLLERMKGTVSEALAIIDGVSAERLKEEINPQKHVVSVLEAIYQVVGHFQQHTGQIIFATKIFTGEDLGFYRPLK